MDVYGKGKTESATLLNVVDLIKIWLVQILQIIAVLLLVLIHIRT